MLSNSCIYGLRASVYIAAQSEQGTYTSIRTIAEQLGISFYFLTKILQQLTDAGLMQSYRGPGGGIRLARPACEVTLLEIIEVLEGEEFFSGCILKLEGCGDKTPCAIHKEWARIRKEMKAMFAEARLDQLAGQLRKGKIRLADVAGT